MRAYGEQGSIIDLSGATLVLEARRSRSSAPVTLAVSPLDLTEGIFQWDRVANELAPGCWMLRLAATRDGKRVSYPSNMPPDDFYEVDVYADLTGATP